MPRGIKVENKAGDVGELTIYGYITEEKWLEDDVTPSDFKAEMDKLSDKKRINVYINSGGGGVFAGRAICSILERSPADTWGYNDGVSASTASWILQSCKHRIVSPGSFTMVHNPTITVSGEAKEIRESADFLDKVKEMIIASYKKRTGTSSEEISNMMDAETWMDAEEAVAFGFADAIDDSRAVNAMVDGGKTIVNGIEIDTGRYRQFPSNRVPVKPVEPVAEPAPQSVNYSQIENEINNKNLFLKLLEV
jgi:ATP-dependent Clp protease protease subunit